MFQVDQLQLNQEHQRVNLQKHLAEAESRERRIREEADDRVSEFIGRKLNVHVCMRVIGDVDS